MVLITSFILDIGSQPMSYIFFLPKRCNQIVHEAFVDS